jgi:hypothetical protein
MTNQYLKLIALNLGAKTLRLKNAFKASSVRNRERIERRTRKADGRHRTPGIEHPWLMTLRLIDCDAAN